MKWLLLTLLGLSVVYTQAQECPAEEEDPYVYLFASATAWGQYEFLNENGEIMGLGYDIARSVCNVMNRKCKFTAIYDYSLIYDKSGKSIALNNGWFDAVVNYSPTTQRVTAYSFFGAYATEADAYMYVKKGNRMNTVDEIRRNANKFGFGDGYRTSPQCLAKYLDISLEGKTFVYDNLEDVEQALINEEVDVVFLDQVRYWLLHEHRTHVDRVGNVPIRCSLGGISVMTRKDHLHRYGWFDEGLSKLKANGDYAWLCNIHSRDYDIGCYD